MRDGVDLSGINIGISSYKPLLWKFTNNYLLADNSG